MLLAVRANLNSTTGPQGVPGAPGPQGPPGVGIQGPQGMTVVGSQGTQGVPGVGSQGPQGAPGIGTQGPQGSPGVGTQGNQGPQGIAGASPPALPEATATPTMTLIQPSVTWSITQQGSRVTRLGSIVTLQTFFVLQGSTIFNGTEVIVEFVLPKATFGTPVPLNSPGNVLTNNVYSFGDSTLTLKEASVILQSQDATNVTYRYIPTVTPPMSNGSPFQFRFNCNWYAV